MKIDFDIVFLAQNETSLKVTTFSQLVVVSSIQIYQQHRKLLQIYRKLFGCSIFENLLF